MHINLCIIHTYILTYMLYKHIYGLNEIFSSEMIMLVFKPKIFWYKPKYQAWEDLFGVVGHGGWIDSQTIVSTVISPGPHLQEVEGTIAVDTTYFKHRAKRTLIWNWPECLFPDTRRHHASFHRKEAVNSPTQLWCLWTTTMTSIPHNCKHTHTMVVTNSSDWTWDLLTKR